MKYLATVSWLAAVALLIGVSFLYVGETRSFHGVAEATETIISVEAAAEILDVMVSPGQTIQLGDTLVKLRRGDLALRISELSRELEGNQGKLSIGSSELDQKMAEIRADLETRKGQLAFQKSQLQEQRNRNLEITARLKSLPQNEGSSAQDGLLQRIQSLETEIQTLERNASRQIALLQGSQGLQKRLGATERTAMEGELALLRAEEAKLTIVSTMDGVVASVNLHKGEKVSAFTPILTLTAHSPTLIRGYIPEKVYTSAKLGDSVKVISVAERGGSVEGRIIGVGSRIVELPVRLRKVPEVLLWGREVMVRIPAKNHFLLGEMVSVHGLDIIPIAEVRK